MSVLVFFISLVSIYIMIWPFKLKSKISYNVLKNKGNLTFYFYKIKILTLKIKIKSRYIYFITKKGKVILLPLDFKNQKNIDYVDLASILLQKTTINTVKISMSIGVENNPFETALIFGALQILNNSILSIIKTKKLSTILNNRIVPVFDKNSGTIYVSSSLSITLIDYVLGITIYMLKIKKVGKNYEARE